MDELLVTIERVMTVPADQAHLKALGEDLMKLRLRAALFTALFDSLACAAAAAGAVFEPLILSGEPAPGVSGTMRGFIDAVLAENGDVAFNGVVTGPGIHTGNDVGIWLVRNGQVELLAREGDLPPGYSVGERFTAVDPVSISDDGEAFFTSRILRQNPVGTDHVQWRGEPGNLAIVSRQGEPTPGAVPALPMHRTHGFPLLTGDNVAFIDFVGGSGQRIWSGPPEALRRIVQAYAPAVDIGGGVVIDSLVPEFSFSRITANAHGSVVFNAGLDGPGVVREMNDVGMFFGQSSELSLIVRTGDQAPGVEPGTLFKLFDNPVINANNQVAFRAELRNTPPTSFPENTGIWVGSPGALGLAARRGTSAPGAPGRTFDLLYEPVLNSSNQLAFVALLDRDGGESDYGLWVGTPDNLQMVVGPAHILPGAPAGFEFSSFPFHYRTGENGLLMNSRGDVVFPAQLAPPGPGPSLRGIWAYIGQSLQKVAMEGDVIDIAPDPFVNDFKEVSAIGAVGGTGGTDGRRSSLNDARQLVLEIRFTDGTEGLFLTRLVPEPSAAALLISAMAPLYRPWRGRSMRP